MKARLATYEAQTRPLLDYYKAARLLYRVDGTREPEAIYNDVAGIIAAEQVMNS